MTDKFSEKDWKSTRMSEAEGSGVAAAIKKFNAAWPDKLSEVDGKQVTDAFAAIDVFEAALTKARGKCNAVKKPDAKKLKATTDLITLWEKDLKNCRTSLDQAREKKQQKVAAEIEKEREEKREKIIAGVEKLYRGVVTSLEDSGGDLDELDKAIKAADLTKSYKLQTQLSKGLRTVGAQLTTKAVQEKLGYALQDLKLKNENLVKVKECTPKEFPTWKRALAGLNRRFEELETALDGIEDQAASPDPDGAEGSPEYKRNLKTVMADYKGVLAVCETTLKAAVKLSTQAKQLEAKIATLPPEVLPGALKIADKISEVVQKNMEDMKTSVETVRTSSSALVKKKAGFKIGEQDEAKFLVPILNKTFSKNLRALKLLVETEQSIADMREH